MPRDKEGFDDPNLTYTQMAEILAAKAEFAFNENKQELAAAFATAAGLYECANQLSNIVHELLEGRK